MTERENKSEIVNQKKQFIFEVEQTQDFVLPTEKYKYYVYIKNLSGSPIRNFRIQVENNPAINLIKEEKEDEIICLQPDGVMLYTFEAFCDVSGKHLIHFIAYGDETQVLYRTLEIKCGINYKSDDFIHRIHFYDFSPYEDKYSLEASNYTDQAIQILKRQKLPYKSTKFNSAKKGNFSSENVESLSFLEQYEEAKNTNEHVYQYISRENFAENSLESFEGKNLFEIFEKINKNSEYFRGKFFRSGTNELLNDFIQYAPNGFIYRMGLLSSEIYHNLGVIPTYNYMSDRLFRWAPDRNQPLDLIPEKKAMEWDKHLWAGSGWIIYKVPTVEYKNTEEYIQDLKKGLESNKEIVGVFERKETAEEAVKKLKQSDEYLRESIKSDIIKYDYPIVESLYDNGVFFINIPMNKIPANFYLIEPESLMKIVNRAKPYGTKPVLNYILEETFNQTMDFNPLINYRKSFEYESEFEIGEQDVIQGWIKNISICKDESMKVPMFIPQRIAKMIDMATSVSMDVDIDKIKRKETMPLDFDSKEELSIVETERDYSLKDLDNLLELLYQNNYNEIGFRIEGVAFNSSVTQENVLDSINLFNDNCIQLQITNRLEFNQGNTEDILEVSDNEGKRHNISVKYDKEQQMDYITYNYVNKNDKSFVRRKGYQNIDSINVIVKNLYNKKILIFMVGSYSEEKQQTLHYFHHVIIQDVTKIELFKRHENQKTTLNNVSHRNISNQPIIFELPFTKDTETYEYTLLKNGTNWENLFRLNDNTNSYTYIKNNTNEYIKPNNISLFYDNINIPETAIIEALELNIKGNTATSFDEIYVEEGFNTNYITENTTGNKIQLEPKEIDCYSHLKESTLYYENKLEVAEKKEQDSVIKSLNKLIDANIIFSQDINLKTTYLDAPKNFITINKKHWCEIYDFDKLYDKLNNVKSINFVIEGYNTQQETQLLSQILYDGESTFNISERTIPSGYFREKIPLLYPNSFLLELLRVRFRFKELSHDIQIFDTKLEIEFSEKQDKEVSYEYVNSLILKKSNRVNLLKEEFLSPASLNNGFSINLSFDELKPGAFYQINSINLKIIYQKTDVDMILTNRQYQDKFYEKNKSMISGQSEKYISGSFYDDVITVDSGINPNTNIELREALYQMFETRQDNITSIEFFPNGFVGNPDELFKIGLYSNSYNTPGKLIKEIYVDGWLKNNEKLKNLDSIKYNFNVKGLEINTKYWFKIEVVNPKENSYYLLKGVDDTTYGHKLLVEEDNNYINTFGELKFNIYSKNLSESFNSLPVLQEYFNNPYISIGLHKQGSLKNLQINKYKDDYMDEEAELVSVTMIINDEETELLTETDEE